MNRKKTIRNLHPGSVIFLVLVAIALASAGVFHAYVKNLQVEVGRKIEKTEQRISQHQLDIKTLQMHLDQQLNRFLIRARVFDPDFNSELIAIPVHAFEEIGPDGTRQSLADLARRDP